MKSRILTLVPIALFIMCSNFTGERKSMDKASLSIIGLQKAYLDTTQEGVDLEFLFFDPWLKERDSLHFYMGELDDNFDPVYGYDRLDMIQVGDSRLGARINLPFDHLQLPIGVLYEVGVFYLVPPKGRGDSEWEIDTLINEYFVFHVYDVPEEYQRVVDSLGLEPTVIIRE